MTIDEIKKAVREFYSDTSRSRPETKEALEGLYDDIECYIESLDD